MKCSRTRSESSQNLKVRAPKVTLSTHTHTLSLSLTHTHTHTQLCCGGACVARPQSAVLQPAALRQQCDALTLQVLDPHVADLPDKFLPLEPVLPLVSSHLERRTELQGPRAGSLTKPPRVEEEEEEETVLLLLPLLLQWPGGLSIVRLAGREPCKLLPQAEGPEGFNSAAGHRCCLLQD